jgi:hypothetical protein
MTHHLVVTKPFFGYMRGDIIADMTTAGGILASEHCRFVTKIIAPNRSEG